MIAESSDIHWDSLIRGGERGGIYPICSQPGNSRGLSPCSYQSCYSLLKQEMLPEIS